MCPFNQPEACLPSNENHARWNVVWTCGALHSINALHSISTSRLTCRPGHAHASSVSGCLPHTTLLQVPPCQPAAHATASLAMSPLSQRTPAAAGLAAPQNDTPQQTPAVPCCQLQQLLKSPGPWPGCRCCRSWWPPSRWRGSPPRSAGTRACWQCTCAAQGSWCECIRQRTSARVSMVGVYGARLPTGGLHMNPAGRQPSQTGPANRAAATRLRRRALTCRSCAARPAAGRCGTRRPP